MNRFTDTILPAPPDEPDTIWPAVYAFEVGAIPNPTVELAT
ncbi:MAG: hypothetical protein QGD91_12475 [Actinomycetota bacterium]|nr:hypothetical protein [Actinomycetota bacterium]